MDFFDAPHEFAEAAWIRALGFYPFYRALSGCDGPVAYYDGEEVVMLGSNNYLGLTHHPEVIAATKKAIDHYGTACTGSRLLNGNLALHEELEAELAAFFNKEAALVFATGFLANTGALAALGAEEELVIFSDKENHASIITGTQLAKCDVQLFSGPDDLQQKLDGRLWPHALVITEGIFSMTGRIGPLKRLTELKRQFGFRIYLDDAHGIGVLGPQGRGTAAHMEIEDDIDVLCGTFSKSLASVGGFVASDARVIDFLRHKARALMFTAALPPAATAAALAALRVMQQDSELFERMWANAHLLRSGFESLGLCTMGSQTPIVPVFVGSESLAFRVCKDLLHLGVFTTPVVYPAVPFGRALIRTSTLPTHTPAQLARALAAFAKVTHTYPIAGLEPEVLPEVETMDFSYFLPQEERGAMAQ